MIQGSFINIAGDELFMGYESANVKSAYEFEIKLRNELKIRKVNGENIEDLLDPNSENYILNDILAPFLTGAATSATGISITPKSEKKAPRPSERSERSGVNRLWRP